MGEKIKKKKEKAMEHHFVNACTESQKARTFSTLSFILKIRGNERITINQSNDCT